MPRLTTQWNITAATTTGTSHEREGTACQDAHAVLITTNMSLIAVADGAGSTPHGGVGAQLAVHGATSYIAGAASNARNTPLRIILNDAVLHCRSCIAQRAEQEGNHLSDYATTLLLAVITQRAVGTIQIGDGGIVSTNGATLTTRSVQQRREYCNEVTFLTSNDYKRELHIKIMPRHQMSGIALFTDGVEGLCMTRRINQAHENFFKPVFTMPPTTKALKQWLGSTKVCGRTDDDKTLVIATLRGAEKP